MAKVSTTSTTYLTSRKNRLPVATSSPMPIANMIVIVNRGPPQRISRLSSRCMITIKTIRTPLATKRSNSCDRTAAIGRISLGKYTLVTRLLLEVKLWQENRIDETRNAHTTDFTARLETSIRFNGLLETTA